MELKSASLIMDGLSLFANNEKSLGNFFEVQFSIFPFQSINVTLSTAYLEAS